MIRERDEDIIDDEDDGVSIIRLSPAALAQYCPDDLERFPDGAQIVIEGLSIRIEPLPPVIDK